MCHKKKLQQVGTQGKAPTTNNNKLKNIYNVKQCISTYNTNVTRMSKQYNNYVKEI